jgi:hypothetical protein
MRLERAGEEGEGRVTQQQEAQGVPCGCGPVIGGNGGEATLKVDTELRRRRRGPRRWSRQCTPGQHGGWQETMKCEGQGGVRLVSLELPLTPSCHRSVIAATGGLRPRPEAGPAGAGRDGR